MGESVDAAKGLLFDGFPRTIPQAEAMKTSDVDLDVVEIYVPDATIFERMSGHRVHMASGTISRRSVPLCREALVPLNLPNRASAMKVYIITSGLVFGLLLPAHVACLLQEGVQVAQDPWFTIANGCGSRICDLGMAPAQTARRSLNGPSIKREGGIV